MKTWNEFCKSEMPIGTKKPEWAGINETIYKQIQLDAFKAGERFAAEIVKNMYHHPHQTMSICPMDIVEAILTDANNRTELP